MGAAGLNRYTARPRPGAPPGPATHRSFPDTRPVQTTLTTDVLILCAGARSLMCAHTAAQRGRRDQVVEKTNHERKNIIKSIGGKCTYTNQSMNTDNRTSQNP